MNWKALADDIVLFNDLVNRFVEIGCTEKKAFELATYTYAYNLPVVIKTSIISSDDKQNTRYNTNK
jgi:hypothetical protein